MDILFRRKNEFKQVPLPGISPEQKDNILHHFEQNYIATKYSMEFGDLIDDEGMFNLFVMCKPSDMEELRQNPYALIYHSQISFFDLDERIHEIAQYQKRRDPVARLDAFLFSIVRDKAIRKQETLTTLKKIQNMASYWKRVFRKNGDKLWPEDFEYSKEEFMEGLDRLVYNDRLTYRDSGRYGVTQYVEATEYVQRRLLEIRNSNPPTIRPITINMFKEQFLSQLSESVGKPIQFSQGQNESLKALGYRVSVITGGPGTGKSFLVEMIRRIADGYGIHPLVVAPTGKAAIRLNNEQFKAYTIHRALAYHEGVPRRNENNPLEYDLFIVDETSMVDIVLMQDLLKAIPDGSSIILVGDKDQLPPVGVGMPFADIIATNQETDIPVFELKTNFRQTGSGMDIYTASSFIKQNKPAELIKLGMRQGASFYLQYVQHGPDGNLDANILEGIKSIYHQATQDNFQAMIQNTMVLTPDNALRREINALVCELQGQNPYHFFVGKKVINLTNLYDKNVFNGEIGYVVEQNETGIQVLFESRYNPIHFEYNETSSLDTGYAITVHKSQGSEAQRVIIPITFNSRYAWNKKMFYTAVTRAKQQCEVYALHPLDTYHPIGMLFNQKMKESDYLQELLEKSSLSACV
jgi:RecD/TraA family predicted helicase